MNRLYGVIVMDILCFAIFIGLALAGAKSVQDGGGATKDPGPKNAGKKETIGALRPRTGGRELRLALDTEPPTLDPISIADTFSDGVANKVYNKLVCLRMQGKKVPDVMPDLAESFDISADNTVYTFKLRKGVRFHNGREMKAADVVYSLKRLMSPLSKRADLMFPFVKGSEAYYKANKADELMHDDPNLGIKALDDYTVRIELSEPFAPFIQHLCTISCAVVPKEAAEDKEHIFSRTPLGTGPFKFVEWESNQHLLFKRNDDYFAGKPKLERIRFLIFKDRMLHLQNFMAGELDAAIIPNGHVLSAEAAVGAENMLVSDSMRTNYVGIGHPNGKFTKKADLTPFGTNKYLRQAMSWALDRKYLCEEILEKRAIPAYGVLPPGMPGFKEGRRQMTQDLDKARALMEKAGFPGGKGLPALSMLYRNDEDTKNIAQAFQHDFKKIGISVELQALEWSRFLESVENEPQAMFYLGWVADYPDPDNFLYVLFNSKQWGSAGNHTWFSNAKVDELTERARTMTKMSDRAKLYEEAEDIILDEMPWICTVHSVNKVLLRKEVKGIRGHVTPLDTGTEFPQVDFLDVDIDQ